MDFPFIKEALAQLFSKPSTVQYPFVPAPAKPNYRGRIVFHPDKCINCNMCERVCAGQAISHVSEPCEEGEKITRSFYLGSCTFCSHCASFCTHGAIELSDDYHMVADYYHAESFEEGEQALIVSGTMIKKPPVKKPAPAAAPAPKPVEIVKKPEEAPAAPPASIEAERIPAAAVKKAEAPKAEEAPVVSPASLSEAAAAAGAEIVEAPAAEKEKKKAKKAAEAEEEPKEKKEKKKKKAAKTADADAGAEDAVMTEEAPKKKKTKKKKEEEPPASGNEEAASVAAPASLSEGGAPAGAEGVPTAVDEAPVAPPQPRDDGKPVQDPSKCVYCTLCARNCPAGALTVDRKEKTWTLDEDLCVACGTCQNTCPKDAIIM